MTWGTHPKTISMHICTRTITCLVIQFGANSCTHLNARFVSYYAINTPRGRGKMATILQTLFSNWFSFLQKILDFFIQISLKFICSGPIDNKPSFAKILAWRRTGDKPNVI